MNKNFALILTVALAALGIAGYGVLAFTGNDNADKLGSYVMQLVIVIGGFGGLAAKQAQQGKHIETIQRNTNGRLTAKDNEITRLRAALAEHAPDVLANLDTGAINTIDADH